MPTAQKASVVSQTQRWFGDATGIIFTEYRGLGVDEIQTLRKKLRETGAEYHVIKNTLFRIAVGDLASELPAEFHNGPTATAFLFRDEPACAKVIVDFLKDHKALVVKGGYIEGKVMNASDIEALAKLPSREQLLSQIVGLVAAPMSNLVGVLQEIIASPIRVIGAIEEKVSSGSVSTKAEEDAPAVVPETQEVEESAEVPAESVAEGAEAASSEAITEDSGESQESET